MATELQPPTSTEVHTKPGVNSEVLGGKLPSPLPERPEAAADVTTTDSENFVTGSQGGEIPVDDEQHSESDLNHSNYSNESSAGSTPRHEKAEAFLDARKERVEVEANAYLESEIRKVNARAHTAQVDSPASNICHLSFEVFRKFPLFHCRIRSYI